ncbi:MAG: ATP-binding protein [Acidobacteriota bacterium]
MLPAVESCATCHGTGWYLREEEPAATVLPCPDCRSQLQIRRLLDQSEVPPRYVDRGFDVFSVHNRLQEIALKRSIEYVEAFPNVPRGLLFVGSCGVGKTHLSVAILRSLVQERRISARFVDEAELLRRLQYSYGPDSNETEKEVLLPLMKTDLVVWDDLGTGRPTEWVRETIRTVINHRYTYERQTIFSTNWPISQDSDAERQFLSKREERLSDRIGHRLLSRIMEMCEVVKVEGPDARLKIHKAGFDFQETSGRKPAIPAGLLACPKCDSRKVTKRDYSAAIRDAKAGTSVEISCQCQECSRHFVARFFPTTARVEYSLFED